MTLHTVLYCDLWGLRFLVATLSSALKVPSRNFPTCPYKSKAFPCLALIAMKIMCTPWYSNVTVVSERGQKVFPKLFFTMQKNWWSHDSLSNWLWHSGKHSQRVLCLLLDMLEKVKRWVLGWMHWSIWFYRNFQLEDTDTALTLGFRQDLQCKLDSQGLCVIITIIQPYGKKSNVLLSLWGFN